MGMTTHIVGFKPADEKWRAMKAALDACKKANIPIPLQVAEFFNDDDPSELGVRVDLAINCKAVTVHNKHSEGGFEVDLTKLDPDIKILRFFNCW